MKSRQNGPYQPLSGSEPAGHRQTAPSLTGEWPVQVAHMSDEEAMQIALAQAHLAALVGEVPVGAVVLHQGVVIAMAHNAPIAQNDPSAHAEMLALRASAAHLGNYRLDNCELFVTLEPCAMCVGAILHARLKRVVYGAADPKTGAAGSVLNLFGQPQLNHHTEVLGGVLAPDCANVLQTFFRRQRQQKSLSTSRLRQDALRTPSSCFESLPLLPGLAYVVDDLPTLQGLRLHYVMGGQPNAHQTILCLHGSLEWSLAWRHTMHTQMASGARVVALDLIGFGQSDKPKKASSYTLAWHAQVLTELLERLNLIDVVLVVPEACDAAIHALGKLTMALAAPRVVALTCMPTDSLDSTALAAPFPDKGFRAIFRAFEALTHASGTPSLT
jgi:tRNA(adenine34) deaminase